MSKICDNIILWFRTIRPQTLLLSLIPVFVAIIVVDKSGIPINIMTAVLTASCAVSLQILSNLTNDYYDFLKGADKAGRVGYKRAMAEGSITVSAMRRACLIAAFIACLLGPSPCSSWRMGYTCHRTYGIAFRMVVYCNKSFPGISGNR